MLFDMLVISAKYQRRMYREYYRLKLLEANETLDKKSKKYLVDKAWNHVKKLKDTANGWCSIYFNNVIFLNLQGIADTYVYRNSWSKRKLTFYQSVAEVISHETMHLVLDAEQGVFTSKRYDNIANKLRSHNGVIA